MTSKIKVQAQYFENYSDTKTPHWKPKGSQEFIFPVSSDWVMYVREEEMVEAIEQMLANYSHGYCRYEYREHDVSFSDPIVLTGLQEMKAEIFNNERKVMKKILYLHGLESKPGGPKVDFLSSKGMVYAPAMNYESLNLHEFILTLEVPDLIIGSSMGGYVADVIGSRLGVDVLLFNPALHSREIAINHEYYNNQYKRTIVLGTEDDVINPELTKKLWSVNGNHAEYDEIEGMGHKIPGYVFKEIYNKYNYEN